MHEGQIVNAGTPLLHLDDTRFASNVGETEADKLGLRAKVERLTAEVENQDFVISPEIASRGAGSRLGETELYNSRREQFQTKFPGSKNSWCRKTGTARL